MRLAFPGLSSRWEEDSTIVTSSPLLAAVASQQFAKLQLGAGITSWRRPAVHSIEAWLVSCWQEACFASAAGSTLLSPAQERLLWQSIIQQQNPNLFDVSATARLAREASNVAAEWHLPPADALWDDQQDAQQFVLWQESFRGICLEQGWITRSDLWKLALRGTVDGIGRGSPVVFVGFDRVSPALALMRKRIPNSQFFANNDSLDLTRPRVSVRACSDFKEEIEHAARWARAHFEQGRSRSIAVFVPNLRDHSAFVERTFKSVFYSASAMSYVAGRSLTEAEDSVFHINDSASLHDHPLAASALLLLDLSRPRINHANAAAILRCPFIRDAAGERSLRALADLSLRRMRELDVSLRDMERASRMCPSLLSIWTAVRSVIGARPQQAELASWSRFIGDLVQATGWPGDLELTYQEQEVVEAWNDALSTLGSLGMMSPPVPYEVALGHLKRILAGAGLPVGDWLSPVQILDASEASGLQFDCAFLTGLSDETWPPALRTSSLIPLKLQRAHQVPNSTPVSLQAERERLTRALFAAGPRMAATYSGRLSPLAEPFVSRQSSNDAGWTGKLPVQSFPPAQLDEVEDSMAPPFDVTQDVRGGTSIIKLQSLCPFRAFAEIRLRSQLPEDACFGFDSRDRGGFLHKALQYVWQELKTLASLRALPSAKLQSLVQDAVARAVREEGDSPFRLEATSVERERLEYLILDWLNTVEKERLQPFTVETLEDEIVFELAGLPLRLRVDRIDRLKNGQLLLIDYKSGKQTRGKLDCPRPAEPQLLVYAAAKGAEVDGIFFGEVKPRDLRVVGFSREKQFKSRSVTVKKNEWEAFTEEFGAEVHRLAEQFLAGQAVVDPLGGACEYCNNKPLCRVNEQGSLAEKSLSEESA